MSRNDVTVTFSAPTAYQLREHIAEVTGFRADTRELEGRYKEATHKLNEANDALELQQTTINTLRDRLEPYEAIQAAESGQNRTLFNLDYVRKACQDASDNPWEQCTDQIRNMDVGAVDVAYRPCAMSAFVEVYNKGYEKGREKGRKIDRDDGYTVGYAKACDDIGGIQAGSFYSDTMQPAVNAFTSAHTKGFNSGYDRGRETASGEHYTKGYTEGYNKGRDEQIAEHRNETVNRKPSRADAMLALFAAGIVSMRPSEDSAAFVFVAEQIVKYSAFLGAFNRRDIRTFPHAVNDGNTVGIVGRHSESGEIVFVHEVYEWTPAT